RVDQFGRARVRADGSSRGRGGGGDPGRSPQVGGTAAGSRGPEGGRARNRGRSACVSGAAVSQILAAGCVRVHRRDSADVGGQVQEERAATAVQGVSTRCLTPAGSVSDTSRVGV